jgi:hypothetical protein
MLRDAPCRALLSMSPGEAGNRGLFTWAVNMHSWRWHRTRLILVNDIHLEIPSKARSPKGKHPMRNRTIALTGAILSFGLLVLHYAIYAADFFSIIHLPQDLREAFLKIAAIPMVVSSVVLLIGIICVGYLAWDLIAKRNNKSATPVNKIDLQSSTNGLADDRSKELAGIVNAMRERALDYNLDLPLPAGDPFTSQYIEIRKSTHPIWTDPAIRQLRRDFLNRSDRVVSQLCDTVAEVKSLRAELNESADALISKLLGNEGHISPNKLQPPQLDHMLVASNSLSCDRISILELMRFAEMQGWKIAGENNLEAVDLMDALRQAGVDGLIQFWGKKYGGQWVNDVPLVMIDKTHWQDFQFDWQSVIGATENKTTRTYNFFSIKDRYSGAYFDIHADANATAWLATQYAISFKGRRQKVSPK